jgi:hypothetical protein
MLWLARRTASGRPIWDQQLVISGRAIEIVVRRSGVAAGEGALHEADYAAFAGFEIEKRVDVAGAQHAFPAAGG